MPGQPAETYRTLLAVTHELARGDPQYLAMLCARFMPETPVDALTFAEVRNTFDNEASEFASSLIFAEGRPLEDTLRDIALGELDLAIFVELRATSISAFVVESDSIGTPAIRDERVDEESWRVLVPELPASAVEQAVALASGEASRGISRQAIETRVQELLRRLGVAEFPKRSRLVLLRTLFGWRVHDLVAKALTGFVGAPIMIEHPSSNDTAPGTVLRAQLEVAIANAPLRYEYALLTASIDPSNQAVTVESFPLFYRETSRLYGATKDIQILAPPSLRERLQVVVVARLGSRVEDSVLVGGGSIALPAGQACRLWVELEGPGRVTFPNPPVQLLPSTEDLSAIIARVPQHSGGLHAAALDLMCVLDLIGDESAVRYRITTIAGLVGHLQKHYPIPGSLKVGLLAYRDTIHVEAELAGAPQLKTVQRYELGDPEALLRFLAELEAFDHPARDFPGALDLAIADLRNFRWRRNSQHSLFTVAAHPPHPAAQGHHRLIPNADGLDWTRLLAEANQDLNLRSVLAHEKPSWSRPLSNAVAAYLNDSWQTLGYTYRSELGEAGIEVFAEELDPSLAEVGGTLRLPLVVRGAVPNGAA